MFYILEFCMTSSNLVRAELDSTFDLRLEHGLPEWCLRALQLVVDDEATVRPHIEMVVTHTDATNLVLKIYGRHVRLINVIYPEW